MFEYLSDIFTPAHLRMLWRGTLVTIQVTLLAGLFGLVLGLVSALGRMSGNRLAWFVAGIYIEFFRGTPLLVQLFIIYFGLPSLPFVPSFDAYWAGVVGLSLYAGAYFSEIIRGAFNAIPKGQREAARVLGLGTRHMYLKILIPQATRNAVPALGNQFISLIKDSTLVSVITVSDLLLAGRNVISRTFEPFTVYLAIAFVYLILSNLAAVAVGFIERHYDRPYRQAR
jgi:His/Glu/Gln/Arg/opine family amino acid ABC transporter permease subunit